MVQYNLKLCLAWVRQRKRPLSKRLQLVPILLMTLVLLSVAITAQMTTGSLSAVSSGTTHTYTFQAIKGVTPMTTGGGLVELNVGAVGSVPGLPLTLQMTDLNNGRYTASFTADPDTFFASVKFQSYGLWENTWVDEVYWYGRWVYNMWYFVDDADDYSVYTSGVLVVPYTDTYHFYVHHDDSVQITIGGFVYSWFGDEGLFSGWGTEQSWFSVALVADVEYNFLAQVWNPYNECILQMYWYSQSGAYPYPYNYMPNSVFRQPSKTLAMDTSAAKSTFTYSSTHIEDQPYQVTLQMRDQAGNINNVSTDEITVHLVYVEGVGATSYQAGTSYISYGRHQATLWPTHSGVYHLKAVINAVETSSYEVIVFCDFLAWTPPNQFITVEMGYTESFAFSPTFSNGLPVPTTSCPLTLTTADGSDLLTFADFDMTVTTVDPLLVGNPRINQVRTVTMTRPDYAQSLDFTVTVDVIPSCTLSTLQEVTPPADMSTPIFGNIFQDLVPVYTHAYVDFWPVDTCVIAFEIKNTGDTSYLTCNSVSADPQRTNYLHLYPYIFSDEGIYPTEVVATYLHYLDQVPPPNSLTSTPFTVTVEPECKITSFMNDPSVSTTLETHYSIGDPVQQFVFDIRYEPVSCNYIKEYSFTIDGQAASPTWLSVDTSSEPHRLVIQTDGAGDSGIYSLGVGSATNTTPKYVSTDHYIIKVTISFDSCSSLLYDTQNFPDLHFEIADGAPAVTQTFTTHTDSGGFFNCGPRQYKLVQDYPGFVFEGRNDLTWDEPLAPYNQGDQLTQSFETTDPFAVGSHEIIVQVESVDFTEWNEVIYHLEYFNIVVTASCWDTVMQYDAADSPLGYHQQIVGQAATTIDVAPVKDTVSLASTPFDGFTYCGTRTFSLISVTTDDHPVVDDTWITFNADDTFTVESLLNSQWGLYTVTFGVELDIYPDFVMQELAFDVEIVPDCLNTVFQVLQQIAFEPIYRNLVSTVDFAGFFTYDLEGAYDSFCGSLEYELDPTGPAQTYLNHDGLTLLTLEPDQTHPTGVLGHTMRVRLVEFQAAFLDVPFTVEVVACDINAFYADFVDTVAISPARENAVIGVTDFVIGTDTPMTFAFTFGDFDVVQSSGCEAAYAMEYQLFVDGSDVSLSPPDWVAAFDPEVASVTVEFFDLAALGSYSLTIKGELMTNPSTRISASVIDFTFNVLADPCLLDITLLPALIPQLEYTIRNNAVATVHTFAEMTTSIGYCGPADYVLTDDSNILTVDSATRTLSLSSFSGYDVGAHTIQMTATLQNYPSKLITIDFQVVIWSVCTDTVMFFRQVKNGVYFESIVPMELDLTVKDRAGQEDGGDGFSLCGRRTYEITKKESMCVNHEVRTGMDRVNGDPVVGDILCEDTAPDAIVYADDGTVFLQFPVPTVDGNLPAVENNVKISWHLTVRLEEYPDVAEVQLVFNTFKMKSCDRQVIISTWRNKDHPKPLQSVIGVGPKEVLVDLVDVESEASFQYFGHSELAEENHCGLITVDIFRYNYFGEADLGWWNHKQKLPTEALIDKQSKLPSFLNLVWNEGRKTIGINFQSDDEDDAGEHFFIMNVYLADFPKAAVAEAALVQINAIVIIKFVSQYSDAFTNNVPPEWIPEMMEPDCPARVVRVKKTQPTRKDNGGHDYFIEYYARDPDYSNNQIASFVPTWNDVETVNEVDKNECPGCVFPFIYDSPLDYEEGQPYKAVMWLSGIPEWVYKTTGYSIIYSDGLSTISKIQLITFIPEEKQFESDNVQTGDCMSYQQVLAKYNQEVKEEVVEEEVVEDLAAVEIEVVIEETNIVVEQKELDTGIDFSTFFQQLQLLQSQKADFEEGSPLYRWAMKELAKLPFPFPLVIKVTRSGTAHVHFSKPINIPAQQDIPNFVLVLIEENWIDLSLKETEQFARLLGNGYYDPSFWEQAPAPVNQTLAGQTESQSDTNRRRLQTATAEQADDLSFIKDFSWTVSKLTATRMEIKLNFDIPRHISPDVQDRLVVSFVEVEKFLQVEPTDLKSLDLGVFNQTRTIPRQLEEAQVEVIEQTSQQISGFIQASSLVNIAVSALQGQSLQQLWGSLSSLQLTVHIPLNNIAFPTVVEILFSELIKIVTFDVLESLDEIGYGLEYEVTPTVAFNDGFDTLGYDSSEPIGLLGTINFLLGIVVLQILWFFTPRILCLRRYPRGKGEDLTSNLIRFWLQLVFETLICSGAVFYPRDEPSLLDIAEPTDFEMFLIIYSALIAFLTITFLALTIFVACRYPRKTVKQSQQIRKLEGAPLRRAMTKIFETKKEASLSTKQHMLDEIMAKGPSKNQTRSLRRMSTIRVIEENKIKYFKEYFIGLVPHSQLAQFYQVVYLWRRFLIVFIAFQLEDNPEFQIGCFTFLCLFNLVYLLHAQLQTDRWMYQLEIINDISVYAAGIHGLTFMLTVTSNLDAFDAAGNSLVGIVIINLLFNVAVLVFSSCVRFKKNLTAKYARAQHRSRAQDRNIHSIFTCNCTCVSCGVIETQGVELTQTGKKMRNPVERALVSQLKLDLLPCELIDEPVSVESSASQGSNKVTSILLTGKAQLLEKRRQQREGVVDLIGAQAKDESTFDKSQKTQLLQERRLRRERIDVPTIDSQLKKSNLADSEISIFDKDDSRLGLSDLSLLSSPVAIDKSKLSPNSGSICTTSSDETSSDEESEDEAVSLKQARYRYWAKRFGDIDLTSLSHEAKRVLILEDREAQRGIVWDEDNSRDSLDFFGVRASVLAVFAEKNDISLNVIDEVMEEDDDSVVAMIKALPTRDLNAFFESELANH